MSDTNFTLKYGSYSAMMSHVRYIIAEQLCYLNRETRLKLNESIEGIIAKFMEDNNLYKYLDQRRP